MAPAASERSGAALLNTMKLDLPDSYEIPDGVQPDQPFDAVATIVLKPDGSFTLTAIDGVELEPDDEDESEVEETVEEPPAPRDARLGELPWDQ